MESKRGKLMEEKDKDRKRQKGKLDNHTQKDKRLKYVAAGRGLH